MILFFGRSAAVPVPPPSLPDGYELECWHPAPGRWTPVGLPLVPAAFWTAMHRYNGFANRDYGMVVIRRGGIVAHHLLVTPRWYRFPFMSGDDIQIGAVHTAPAHRGQGLAKAGILAACAHWARPARQVWYLVEPDNGPSIGAARACGFALVGEGDKQSRLGLRVLGRYALHTPALPEVSR